MSKKVLIVDDDDLNREIIAELLDQTECQFDVAENGLEAVRLASVNRYDVIFMDIMMPVMDGVAATREIRRALGESCPPKIIAVTAKKLNDNFKTWAEAGFNDFVGKPFSEQELLRAL